jgi:hypothetical protein
MARHCSWLIVLLVCAARAQDRPVATLEGPDLRVEVYQTGDRLEERYLAKADGQWVRVAVSAGHSEGPVSIHGASGEVLAGSVQSVWMDGGALMERLSAGPYQITRTLRKTDRDGWVHVMTRLQPGNNQAELHAVMDRFRFDGVPDWSYAPSVGGFVPDAQYKTPLILTQQGRKAFAIVADVATLSRSVLERCQHALNLDVPAGPFLSAGFVPARPLYHSVFTQNLDRKWAAGQLVVNSYFVYATATASPGEAFREAVRFEWERFGRRGQSGAASQQTGTDPAYKTLGLWDDWRRQVWEEESRKQWLTVPLPDGSAGGAVRTIRWGEPDPSVYMSAWFNSVRTAVGMGLYARRTASRELLDLATGTVRLALAAPGPDGAFKCVAVPRNGGVVWVAGDGAGESVQSGYLGFDMSWTGYWLLKWRAAGLPDSEGILPRCQRLAKFLIARQRSDGMIPTRFDESGVVQDELSRTVMAETGPAALFLLELYAADRNPAYLQAGLRALGFLERDVIPQRKWYDFETFFSCSPRTVSFDERTHQWPANNLALIPAVGAYLAAYRAAGDPAYLRKGESLLDYLLLYQQVWTNPVLQNLTGPQMLLGGFTTQNSDAEWSDARQSQAGNLLLDYYRETGNPEYLERGVAALRAQFPISPSENWAHSGYGKKAGVSSFHWGSGSGMAGIELEEDFLHDAVVDVAHGRATGVNGIDISACEIAGENIRLTMASPYDWSRQPVVAFRRIPVKQRYHLFVNGSDLGWLSDEKLAAGVAVPAPTKNIAQ